MRINIISVEPEAREIINYSLFKRIEIQKKLNGGDECIDLRFWYRYENEEIWRPTKQGIILKKETWEETILPRLLKFFPEFRNKISQSDIDRNE